MRAIALAIIISGAGIEYAIKKSSADESENRIFVILVFCCMICIILGI